MQYTEMIAQSNDPYLQLLLLLFFFIYFFFCFFLPVNNKHLYLLYISY